MYTNQGRKEETPFFCLFYWSDLILSLFPVLSSFINSIFCHYLNIIGRVGTHLEHLLNGYCCCILNELNISVGLHYT